MTEAGQSFSQTEILLTGANGFLGKVIAAFLLNRYPEFKRLHVLLRPRGDLSAAARFQTEVLSSPPLRTATSRPGGASLEEKIRVLPGDISSPECGLSADDLGTLRDVGLIINCAGKVDFFPPIDDSFGSNVDGVENVIALARRCGAKLLHVSTCFTCGEADGLVEESEPILGFYPHRQGAGDQSFDYCSELREARAATRQIYASDDGDKQRRSRELSQRLVALGRQRAAAWGWVNTYTYSKSLGEQIIAASEGLEYAIVRPAIVESSWQFPFPGWIEGGRTAAPLVLMALGGQKDWPVIEDAPLEIVPVDMVAAAILAVALMLLKGRHEKVYQLGSADENPVTLGSIIHWLDGAARRRKNGSGSLGTALIDRLAGARRSASLRFVSEAEASEHRAKHQSRVERLERRVAALAQIAGRAKLPGARALQKVGGELRKLSLQSKFRDQTLDQYLPFVLRNRYIFECENIRAAYKSLSEADRKLLPWRPEEIDWERYWVHNQIEGIEKWIQPEAVRDWSFKI